MSFEKADEAVELTFHGQGKVFKTLLIDETADHIQGNCRLVHGEEVAYRRIEWRGRGEDT
jgi:hypothetical protein